MSTSGRVKRVRPGDEVETYCGQCKQERTHQVVALKSEGVPERVVCRYCHSNHLYRDKKAAAGRASNTTRTSSAREVRRLSQASATPPRAYSIGEVYAEGDVVEHPKFGHGRVVGARAGKIDIKFESGLRTLLHAG